MKLGVIGLPNVGKSTLFNAITQAGAQAANYPFCTIEPNVGVVAVPDKRLDVLAEMYHPEKYTPTTIEFGPLVIVKHRRETLRRQTAQGALCANPLPGFQVPADRADFGQTSNPSHGPGLAVDLKFLNPLPGIQL